MINNALPLQNIRFCLKSVLLTSSLCWETERDAVSHYIYYCLL